MRRLTIALFCVALTGCGELLGIEDLPRGNPDASVPADTSAPLNEACVQCARTECGAEQAACDAESSCADLSGRLDHCQPNDVMCRAHAETDTGTVASSDTFIKLDRCRRGKCIESCYGTGGLIAALDSRCACADKACADKVRDCIQSELATGGRVGMCERRIACMAGRPDPDGFVECNTATPGGGNSYPLLDCARKHPCDYCPLATGKLECLGQFVYGNNRGESLSWKISVKNPLDGKAIKDATVRACAAPQCEPCDPAVAGPEPTDASGKATLATLPIPIGGSFTGCFRVEPPATNPDKLLPMLIYSGRKVHVDEDVMGTLMLGEAALAFYAATVEKKPDPTRGHVIGTVHDCLWGHLSAAVLDPIGDADTVLAYIDGIQPKPGRTSTTSDGSFAYLNVPAGRYTVRVTLNSKEIAAQEIQVVAGHITDVNLYPKEAGE